MAFFGVTVEEIEKVWSHSNPKVTRLSIAKVKGLAFQFVTGKDQFKPGDKVLYFPLDSKIPEELIKKMGMEGKFSGKDKNVVKTVVLMLEISQGYVTSPVGFLPGEYYNASPDKITEYLGVTKYEVPPVELPGAILNGLPSGLSEYDIEGADRNQEVVELLMDQDIVVFEKMEGENGSTFKNQNLEIFINTQSRSIVEKEGFKNRYCENSRSTGIFEAVRTCTETEIGIYYEICGAGIHGNIYELMNDKCFIFDIRHNGNWLNFNDFKNKVQELGLSKLIAPILFTGKLREFLSGKTIQQSSYGFSQINPKTLREGIVIKPVKEQLHSKLGRLIIKQRCPIYLGKSGN